MSDGGADDEAPPESQVGRTPAERAGATPLDPERFKVNAGMPVVQRQREIVGKIPIEDDTQADPVVRRRPRGGRPRHDDGRRWLVGAAILAVVGVLALVAAVLTEADVAVAEPAPPELAATTPVLSARRVPDLVVRPVAARNLRESVGPVLAQAPSTTCLQIRDGANALVSNKETDAMIPASNLKVVTAAAALGLLDPQSRLTTRFATDGAPTDGKVVRGNLYMIGGGDPLLSTSTYLSQLPHGRQPSTDMNAVADQIAATGIRQITGSVVGDDSRYDAARTVPSWPQRYITQRQVAPLSALTVDDAWSSTGGTSGEPAVHAASVLTRLLEERGIQVDGAPQAGTAPQDAAPLTEVESLTIAELVDEALQFSDNTTVELLVKEVGLQAGGEGSTDAGLEAIRGWLDTSGLPAEGVVLADGSGLSEDNRVTCTLLTSLLEEDGADGVIAEGLARPGEPGTLDDRLLDPDLRDRVRAKTGTLRPVTALSGWLRTVPERNLGFSFLINRPDGQVTDADTALQGRLLTAMLDYPQAPDPSQLAPSPAAAPAG